MIPSVMERPADGPLMLAAPCARSSGNPQATGLWLDPEEGQGRGRSPQPVSRSPLGGVPSVTERWAVGPDSNTPVGLIFDCSTVMVAAVPARNPCSPLTSPQAVVMAFPLMAVMIWDTLSTWSAGDPGTIP